MKKIKLKTFIYDSIIIVIFSCLILYTNASGAMLCQCRYITYKEIVGFSTGLLTIIMLCYLNRKIEKWFLFIPIVIITFIIFAIFNTVFIDPILRSIPNASENTMLILN